MNICSIDDCDNPTEARGFCRKHYARWRAHGDATVNKNPPASPETFWAKINIAAPTECWEWTNSKNSNGYGHFCFNGKVLISSRVAFYLDRGKWPKTCRHTCDNPSCCNPHHLVDGTQADNVNDREKRGRTAKGSYLKHSILTEDLVRDIKTSLRNGEKNADIARRLCLDPSGISKIKHGLIWKHVT